MANYVDNMYYTDTYLAGKEAVVDAASFNFYARQATQIIRQHTFNRVSKGNIPEEVKMCCCELAELAYKAEKDKAKAKVSSEKVGSFSVEYKTPEQIDQGYNAGVNAALGNWLGMTGLLYRGMC